MEVKTKFEVGQTACFLINSKIATSEIESCKIEITSKKIDINYFFKVDETWHFINESQIFSDKKELIEQL